LADRLSDEDKDIRLAAAAAVGKTQE